MREIINIKERMEPADDPDCLLKIDTEYMDRMINNKLTPEEKEWDEWLDGLSSEEFYNTVKGWMNEWEAECKARKNKRM